MGRSRDGLYRRENRIFAFRYKDTDGRWREKYTGTTDRDEAKTVKQEFEADLQSGKLPTKKAAWKLSEAEEWWIEFRTQRIAPGTLKSERYRLQHFRDFLKNKRLKDITNTDIDNYVTHRLEQGIGAWSINKEVLLWSLILKKAKLWRKLEDDYKPLKAQVSDVGRALTRQQLRKLAMIAETNVDWEAAFYGSVLAGNTGLRGGEIKKLRIGEIDLENRRLRIRRSDTKTDAGARVVELNRDALEAATRLVLRAGTLKPPAKEPEHYLMPKHLSRIKYGPNKGKTGYDPCQHQEYWDTAWHNLTEAIQCPKCLKFQPPSDICRAAGCDAELKGLKSEFSGLRFHTLRHTFITHMVELGVPLGVIQTFVGHMSARMVRHYTHVSSGAARRAVELLDSEPILAISSGLEQHSMSGRTQ